MKVVKVLLITLLSLLSVGCVGVIPMGTQSVQSLQVGMTRQQVMSAWGPPTSCNRAYGSESRDTVCLYYESSRVIAGRRSYTHRDYKSVYYRHGRVVDWQYH